MNTISNTTYEVELKCPLEQVERVLQRLSELEARREEPIQQRDLYFSHPVRDFAQTDEALRLRRISSRNHLTYKGPLIDTQSKTRREIEIELAEGQSTADDLRTILEIMGFQLVRVVAKTRTPYRLLWEQRELELALDDVEGLGNFLEIEAMADEATREAVRDSILRFAKTLELTKFEQKSYLSMLLAQDQTQQAAESE